IAAGRGDGGGCGGRAGPAGRGVHGGGAARGDPLPRAGGRAIRPRLGPRGEGGTATGGGRGRRAAPLTLREQAGPANRQAPRTRSDYALPTGSSCDWDMNTRRSPWASAIAV